MAVDHKAFLDMGDLGKVENIRAAVLTGIRKAKYKTSHEEHHTRGKVTGVCFPRTEITILLNSLIFSPVSLAQALG